jgi:hypothetical protein
VQQQQAQQQRRQRRHQQLQRGQRHAQRQRHGLFHEAELDLRRQLSQFGVSISMLTVTDIIQFAIVKHRQIILICGDSHIQYRNSSYAYWCCRLPKTSVEAGASGMGGE